MGTPARPGPRGGGWVSQGFEGDVGDIFSSVFGEMFRGGRGRGGPQKGADLQAEQTVTLSEAYTGTQTTLRVSHQSACETCKGSGAKPGTSVKTCTECRGSGQVRATRKSLMMAQTCPRCQGAGQMVENPCSDCRGQGHVRGKRKTSPFASRRASKTVRLSVSPEAASGGPWRSVRDLVTVRIEEDARFEREGANLLTQGHVTNSLAALGGEVDIATVQKTVRIHIPPVWIVCCCACVGKECRPCGAGGGGTFLVRVIVDIPTKLTKDQRRLLAELAQTMGETGLNFEEGFLKKAFGK